MHCYYFYKPSGKNLLKAQAHVETAAGKKTANAGKVRSRDPLCPSDFTAANEKYVKNLSWCLFYDQCMRLKCGSTNHTNNYPQNILNKPTVTQGLRNLAVL